LGIALLIAAAIVMPWLSSKKRTLAAKTNSSALKADAVQSSMCAYLAWIALGGLLLNATFKFSWADLMAASAASDSSFGKVGKQYEGNPAVTVLSHFVGNKRNAEYRPLSREQVWRIFTKHL
jgi:hypothetical protein